MASAKKSARSAPAKRKAGKKPAKAAPAKVKASTKSAKVAAKSGRPVAKAAKPAAKAAKPAAKARPAAKKAGKPTLAAQVAKALGVSETQAVAMAIGELGARLNVGNGESSGNAQGNANGKAKAAAAKAPPASSSMGQRLFLALDNRGLDGMGMPVEVIDLPCVLGSGKSCTIWVSSPQIETRHAQITQGDEGWILEDLGSTHGTFFEGSPLGRRVLQHGDLFLLANYLRVRAELR